MAKANEMKKASFNLSKQFYVMVTVIILVVGIGLIILGLSHASPPYGQVTATSGTLTGATAVKANTSATNGHYVAFNNQTTGGGNSLCGFKSGAHTSKVMIIWEENHDYSSVIGSSSAPYINNSIVADCANATNYNANGHYSLPNYMTMTSSLNNGSSYFSTGSWSNDCTPSSSCITSTNSIFQQEGTNWKAFAESMPGACWEQSSGTYATKHNPAVYYTGIGASASAQQGSGNCLANDLVMGSTTSGAFYSAIQSGLPALTTVTPNLQNDMHDGTVQQADTWLSKWIPVITAGSDYQSGKLAILIVMDEGSGSTPTASSHTMALGLSAYTTPASTPSTSYDENSVLRTMEQITGQSYLGNAQTATSMVAGFGF